MLRLEVEDVWTYLEGEAAFGIIDSVTSYAVHGRWHSKKYRSNQWDGIKRFRNYDRSRKQYRLATGFLERVLKKLDALDYPYEVYDDRDFLPPDPVRELKDKSLCEGRYSYQVGAVEAACEHGRGIIHAATGAGKSAMGAGIIASYGCQTLWLTHRTHLLYQTQQGLSKSLGQPVGILGDGKRDIHPVTVAMVQTLDRARKDVEEIDEFLSGVELLIGDEIHNLQSDQWTRTVERLPAPRRFGLTATPVFAGPGMILEGLTGPVIFKIGAHELIRRGVLVPPRIWVMKHDAPKIPAKTKYPTVYSQGVTNSKERNSAARRAAKIMQLEGIPAVTLVRQIKHGNLLMDLYAKEKIRAQFIQGKVKQEARQEWLSQLRDGELDHVIAMVEILGEGVDLPWLRGLINATGSRGGGSAGSGAEHDIGRVTTQVLGRGLRQFPGKEYFEYWDFADTHHRMLASASKDRINTLEEQGYAQYIKYESERQ